MSQPAALEPAAPAPDYHNLLGHGRRTVQIRDYRRQEVQRMMLARVPTRIMAEVLNVSTNTINNDCRVIERHWELTRIKDREKLRRREMRVLDNCEDALIMSATGGNIDAIDALLRVQARRAKLLGLDAPTQAQLEVTGDLEALRQRAAELITDDLARRRELRERAALNGDAIDVESTG